jgi:hypothetical protein
MSRSPSKSGLWLALAALLFAGKPVQAALLDWDTVTWTAGSLSQSFDIDPTNPGNDITITVTGNTSRFQLGTPSESTSITGGITPAESALDLAVDFASRSESITVTVTFNYTVGVTDVNFKLFDVDKQNDPGAGSVYQDQIRGIRSRFNTGPWQAASITGSVSNRVANNNTTNATITGIGDSAETAANGNATINFGTNVLNSFTFTYGSSSSNALADPTIEWIALHDINFKKVPEVGTSFAAGAVCLAAFAIPLVRRWRRK